MHPKLYICLKIEQKSVEPPSGTDTAPVIVDISAVTCPNEWEHMAPNQEGQKERHPDGASWRGFVRPGPIFQEVPAHCWVVTIGLGQQEDEQEQSLASLTSARGGGTSKPWKVQDTCLSFGLCPDVWEPPGLTGPLTSTQNQPLVSTSFPFGSHFPSSFTLPLLSFLFPLSSHLSTGLDVGMRYMSITKSMYRIFAFWF